MLQAIAVPEGLAVSAQPSFGMGQVHTAASLMTVMPFLKNARHIPHSLPMPTIAVLPN